MKRIFAAILALCMLLSLAACGEPDATTAAPTTEANKSVELVTAFETDSGTSMGAFSMAFAYDDNYRSGTMTMLKDDQEAPGTFTCDENYNINHMEINLEEVDGQYTLLVIDCTFDDAHRLLSAQVKLRQGEEESLRYSAEYRYDSEGRKVYSKVHLADTYMSASTIEYREDGQVSKQTTEYQVGGNPAQVTVVGYTYDELGYIKSMYAQDDAGNAQMEMLATFEIEKDGVRYTLEQDGNKLVLLMNDQKKIVLQESYQNDELINKIQSQYDDAGRLLRLEQWSAIGDMAVVITYAYSADGRLLEHKQTNNGEESFVQRTTFQTVEISK